MANLATCPHCDQQLELPIATAETDRVECPTCSTVFPLNEATRCTPLMATILPPAESEAIEPPVAPLGEALSSVAGAATQPDEQPAQMGAQQSWEERLKKALALDGSDDGAPTESEPTSALAAECAIPEPEDLSSAASPNFEFQPDLSPAAANSVAPQKTLADFAAQAESNATAKPAESFSVEVDDILQGITTNLEASTSTDEIDGEANAEVVEPIASESGVASAAVTSDRRVARRGFPKMAAFAVGPIAGGLLGLYGLLWLQGPPADYVGLSYVLPASVLPECFAEHTSEEALAEDGASSSKDEQIHQLLARSDKVKVDTAVTPASANRSLPAPRINATEFVALIDAATDAMPEFIGSDLTTQDSVQRKGQAYMTICRLAEHFDFAKQPALAPLVEARVQQVKRLFISAAADNSGLGDLAHIAGQWWQYDERPSAGIFFAAEVAEAQSSDAGELVWVKLAESASSPKIPVWTETKQFVAGDRIGVVGRMVPTPAALADSFSGSHVVRLAYGFQR